MELKRSVDPEMLAAMADPFHAIVMVWLDWPGAPVYAHSGVGTITWGGHDWLGVGAFGGIEAPEEGLGMVATEAVVSLVGLPEDIYAYADDVIRNRPGRIYSAVVTTQAGNVLIGEPIEIFAGFMDGLRFSETVESGAIRHGVALTLGTGPGARSRASITHSAEDQALRFPGDTAGRLLINARANAEKLTWPEA